MDLKFKIGQRVKIVGIKGSDPGMDRLINALQGRTGEIINYFCVGHDEMPDLIKMVVYQDVYSYDIRFDDNGDIARGIPEPALEEASPSA